MQQDFNDAALAFLIAIIAMMVAAAGLALIFN